MGRRRHEPDAVVVFAASVHDNAADIALLVVIAYQSGLAQPGQPSAG
ncbi:hypothetical protein SNL152K_618 [Streptomyces sp. NL15-2K]|nr:hypothetical protein SNL152K_618 [Streptomyces sp. NL15-2K]